MGSVFSIALTLDVDHQTVTDYPDLTDAHICVRTPHPELTENICAWLTRWNAQAELLAQPSPAHTSHALLLDVLSSSTTPPPEWKGHYVSISLCCKSPPILISMHKMF